MSNMAAREVAESSLSSTTKIRLLRPPDGKAVSISSSFCTVLVSGIYSLQSASMQCRSIAGRKFGFGGRGVETTFDKRASAGFENFDSGMICQRFYVIPG